MIHLLISRVALFINSEPRTSSIIKLKYYLFCLLGIFILLMPAAGQGKVYPHNQFKKYKLNNGIVTGIDIQTSPGLALPAYSATGTFAGVEVLAGYAINRNFTISAGTGLSYYKAGYRVPVFLDIKYGLSRQKLSPFFYADEGILLTNDHFSNTRIFLNLGAGVQYSVNYDFSFVFSGGIWVQQGIYYLYSFANVKAGVRYVF